jgi:Zn-dependent protease with chaperone function
MALLQVVWPTLALLLLRMTGTLKRSSARLREVVAGCDRNNRPQVKNLWQARGIAANAYALPLSGTLVFYDRLLELLNDDEVAAICHHELEHLAESNWVILGRYLGAFAILPMLLILPIFHRWEFLGVIGIFMLMMVWARLAKKLIYEMEIRADATASNRQAEEGVYARTLETLYRESQLPAVTLGKHSTHPHLYDRMLAAGITPEYPRPRTPRKFTALGWLVLIGCFIGYAAALLTTFP